LFERLAHACLKTKTITYKELVARPELA
jgi:hypothetical protein